LNDSASLSEASSTNIGLLGYLERSSYGVFKKAMEGTGLDKEVPQDLPSIVVIGEESSGKSATLERITMLPVFPKAEDFCTKMPVRVKMHHKAAGPTECQIVFQGSVHGISDVDLVVDLNKEINPSETVLQVMDKIHDKYAAKHGKTKCVVPHELIIKISSPDVPTLEIVDLPGIREAPEDLRAATKEIAYSYTRRPETIVLCVVPATSQRLQSSQAMGIVQELKRAERTVCVLTKCDEVNVSKSTQLQRLTQRIKQTDSDLGVELAAVVGVKNRDTVEEEEERKENRSGEGLTEKSRLQLSLMAEKKWFQKWVPSMSHDTEVSLQSLIRALDVLMGEHIVASWIPNATRMLYETRLEYVERLRSFGDDLTEDAAALSLAFSDLEDLVTFKCRHDIDREIQAGLAVLHRLPPQQHAHTLQDLQDRETAQRAYLKDPIDSLRLLDCRNQLVGIVMAHLSSAFEGVEPEKCLDRIKAFGEGWVAWLRGSSAKPSDRDKAQQLRRRVQAFNWGRFPAFLGSLKSDLESHLLERWESHVMPAIREYLHYAICSSPAAIVNESVLQLNCKAIIISKLLAHLFEGQFLLGWLLSVAKENPDMLRERDAYASSRSALHAYVEKINASLRMLEEVETKMAVHVNTLNNTVK